MRLSDTIALLRLRHAELGALGVGHLALYGSVARDQASPESDVDVVVDAPDGRALGLFALARVAEALERILGRKVDVISKAGLDHAPDLKGRIAPDLVNVF